MGFTAEDRKKLEVVFSKVDSLGTFQTVLTKALEIIHNQARQICYLNSQINMTNYRADAQQQYNRKEALKVLNLDPEVNGSDAIEIIVDIAREIEAKATDKEGKKVKIDLCEDHIQRCHFLGQKKKKMICKFIPYRVRMKFLLNKKVINGAKSGKYKNVFITEDLTPMRSRLVWFIKNKCKTKFTNLHTRDGVIRVKKEGQDSDDDPWLQISNPDELFPYLDEDDIFDVELFNQGLHGFKLLPDIPEPDFLNDLVASLKECEDDGE